MAAIEEEQIEDLKNSLDDILSLSDEETLDDIETTKSREEILSMDDVSLIGADEYIVFQIIQLQISMTS